jgi:hypothetical protein
MATVPMKIIKEYPLFPETAPLVGLGVGGPVVGLTVVGCIVVGGVVGTAVVGAGYPQIFFVKWVQNRDFNKYPNIPPNMNINKQVIDIKGVENE